MSPGRSGGETATPRTGTRREADPTSTGTTPSPPQQTRTPDRTSPTDPTVPPLFAGTRVQNVHVFGQTVHLWVVPRLEEIDRRTRAGTGPITDHGHLQALHPIPESEPVAADSLGALALLELDALLATRAIKLDEHRAWRLAVAPMEIVGIEKQATTWSDIQAITLLRTHAPRIVIASTTLARRTLREIDDAVGVATNTNGALRILRPAAQTAHRRSWQRWAIAEAAYEQWQQQHETPTTREPFAQTSGGETPPPPSRRSGDPLSCI